MHTITNFVRRHRRRAAVLVVALAATGALLTHGPAASGDVEVAESPSPSPSPTPSSSPDTSPTPSSSASPSPSPSTSPTPAPVGISTGIGIDVNDPASAVAAAEAAIGAEFVGVRQNASISFQLWPFGSDAVSAGDVYFRNINNEAGNEPLYGGWAGVAAGNADDYIRSGYQAWIDSGLLSPDGPKLILSLHHEQKVRSSSQCGIGCNGDAEAYKAWFRRWVDIATEMGVRDRILFAFVPSVRQYVFPDNPVWGVAVLDPGPEYVDIYGADSYTYASGESLTKPTPYAAGIDLVGQYALDRGKPAMLGEFGIKADSAAAAAYLSQCIDIWRTQGNWLLVMTDADSMGGNLIPVWQSTLSDPAFAWKGEFVWPTRAVAASTIPTATPTG